MTKVFKAALVLVSAFAFTGCVVAPDELEGTDELAGDEGVESAEQAVTNGVVNAACAQSLTLRSSPGGATIGTMYTGPLQGISKFYVQSTSGAWSYGYSYSLGRWGYALSSYLTANYWESGTPGQLGYQCQCVRADGTIMGGGVG
ncbi:hypothetical protein [Sorangium sp. So ce1335]|uniref:hypothetical protein n=1 Tax=Sorangium sp. So ce1335 TaxID=3133335 RepID=UPI003F63675D